jgi:delta-1-pyrroline-5-carboxylate synthetase
MEPLSRSIVRSEARRVVVKAGTSVVTNEDGRPSLVRLGALVEQISELHRVGIQVIFVSSGAVGMGKRLLRKQTRLNMSFSELQNRAPSEEEEEDMMGRHEGAITNPVHRVSSFLSFVQRDNRPSSAAEIKKTYDSACAAAGQFEMMNLYSSLFNQFDVVASQLLLTQLDFTDPARLTNLRYAVDRLLAAGIIPIINENDAVSANLGYTQADIFSDNDSLAALCARSFHADVCLLLTDVDGVYDRPPSEDGANRIQFFPASSLVEIGQKSARGRGGMQAKINAALSAVQPGSKTFACIVASGTDLDSIRATLHPKYYAAHSNSSSSTNNTTTKGTLFVTPGSKLEQLCLEEINGGKEQVRNTILFFSASSSLVIYCFFNLRTFVGNSLEQPKFL